MAEISSNGRRRFSDKWGKHELDVLAVLSSAFPQWLTSRQIAQRVKAYADSYGELADQAAKAAFAKQFQRDRAKLAAMGIAIESRQPEYSSKSDGQDFASYRLQLGDEPRKRLHFELEDLPVLAAANYLAQSLAISTAEQNNAEMPAKEASRSTPRVQKMPAPGLGLDSIAPGLGTQVIPKHFIEAVDSRRYTATVETDGEPINVAYSDSDDLAMFVLEHPGSRIVRPQEAADAYRRRLVSAARVGNADLSSKSEPVPVQDYYCSNLSDGSQAGTKSKSRRTLSGSNQTGSEVDRRLRLLLFLSAHLGCEYTLEELAERFVGGVTSEEKRKAVATIRKDIGTLTTVSDDGEIAGSQFFDIDWTLLEDEGRVCATNSLGLDRLAGISPQYLSLLAAAVHYLSKSPLLPAEERTVAHDLSARLKKETAAGSIPWLSLTGYEVEPSTVPMIREAIKTGSQMDVEYTDDVGRTRRKRIIPAKIFVEEGLYYVAIWDGTAGDSPRDWSTLRIARISKATVVRSNERLDIPDVPIDRLRQWGFENGAEAAFITDKPGFPYIEKLPGATVEPWGDGEKVHLRVTSDSWFTIFCVAHARHIVSVAPATMRSMVVARAQHELSIIEQGE
ncbi:MAG: WYL domain-containing protein [Aeriscardovia sp.]|nr:WYL domain-containing protein [Aeriscardovia sp.]